MVLIPPLKEGDGGGVSLAPKANTPLPPFFKGGFFLLKDFEMPKVIVVGGGYAGLAAATALAEAGHSVDLLESRGFLGGRAYSIAPSETFPAPMDNGPHLFMGCYAETLRLFRRIGVEKNLQWIDPLALAWLTPGGREVSLKCTPWPAPLHLAWGLLFSNAFPWGEKISLARALSAFSRKPFKIPPGVETVAQYL